MRKALLVYAHPLGINHVNGLLAYFHLALARLSLGRVTGYLIGRMEPSMRIKVEGVVVIYLLRTKEQKSFLCNRHRCSSSQVIALVSRISRIIHSSYPSSLINRPLAAYNAQRRHQKNHKHIPLFSNSFTTTEHHGRRTIRERTKDQGGDDETDRLARQVVPLGRIWGNERGTRR
jgi:hypothetical protein